MEVHQHTHTPRKKWTHYFWEFLMLFLAVFCGFLAEYKLEQIIEHHREKDYILSMLDDLKTDTTKINEHVIFRNNRRRYMDSLSILLKQPDYMNNTSLIYYYARLVPRNRFFYNTDRTLQQLKNAGGMRLITKPVAADAILAYDSEIRLLQTQTYSLEAEGIIRFYNMMTSIFDGDVLDAMYGDSVISQPAGNPPFLTNDKKALNELKSQLHFIKSINNFNISIENKLKVQAKTTIDVLKKEYHRQ